MILDAEKGFGHEPPRYDLCIVGAGPAGITLALELEATGLRICLLEAGGAVYEAESQRLREGERGAWLGGRAAAGGQPGQGDQGQPGGKGRTQRPPPAACPRQILVEHTPSPPTSPPRGCPHHGRRFCRRDCAAPIP